MHFPEGVMLIEKRKKMLFPSSCPMEVGNFMQLLFPEGRKEKKKVGASREFRNPPLQVAALSSKESG